MLQKERERDREREIERERELSCVFPKCNRSSYLKVFLEIFFQADLNKKEMQLNLCILRFTELYLFA